MSIAAALLLQGTPAPPPILPHHYHGPVRMCARGLAADIRSGEGYETAGDDDMLHFAEARLQIRSWSLDGAAYRDIAAPLGKVELPGFGTLERWSLGSRNRPGRWTGYVYQASPYSRLEITSNRFDGSDADFAILQRLATGDAAKAMCANVPVALRPAPERDVPALLWFAPTRHPGPATVCTAHLALDVAAGEQALLPWLPGHRFGVERNGARVGMLGDLYPSPTGPMPRDRVLDDPAFALTATPPAKDAPVAYHTLRRANEPYSGFDITFAYIPGTPEPLVRDVAQRLRVRRPDDRCLSSEPR